MSDPDISSLMKAAAERQLAVAALQKKYEQSESIPTEQLVLDMQELWSTERVVLDTRSSRCSSSSATTRRAPTVCQRHSAPKQTTTRWNTTSRSAIGRSSSACSTSRNTPRNT